ncbi:TPA: aspartyl/asparaginyl beta-hydroxylase domain-containing protein, partial [Candidatus Micrarchaeota archaeon]|nr:aspartyl/asparaginyl beta-hydroxylase domain-containing protein [Candidatus Micrarchaeota archaeon]
MQDNKSEIWFADDGAAFKGTEPYFFDPDEFPWVKQVEEQWMVIRDEMMQQLSDDPNKLVPYVNQEMTSRPKQWKTLGLMFWTVKSRTNIALFPKSWEILRGIPNLTAVSFNLLEQQTTIKPHIGNTNAIIRCHLGL